MVLVPDVLRQVLGEERRAALRELRPADKILRPLQVFSNKDPALESGIRNYSDLF